MATEGLGRSPNFDPHSDSSVRVQVSRLRNKIAEYYSTIGSKDPILVEIPKGKYKLQFKFRPSTQAESQKPQLRRNWLHRNIRVAAITSAAVLALVLLSVAAAIPVIRAEKTMRALTLKSGAGAPASALDIFWGPFIHSPNEPFVVFKNVDFVGDASTGMRRFDPVHDKKGNMIQEYTGIGEVMGVLELNELFEKYGRGFHAKRAGLFTVDDARDYNVIFVGSPGNQLSQIPGTQDFILQRVSEGPHRNRLAIYSTDPKSSRKILDAVSSGNQPNGVDYAIVALKRDQDRSNWKLFLEGTSTVATQAAVDFVCDSGSVAELENRLHITSATGPKPFEGLLKVKVANDVPMDINLMDLREVDN